MLNINKQQDGAKVCIALEGRLDTITSPELEEEMKGIMEEADEVTLDLEKLEYISSAGLRVMLSAQKRITAKAGALKVVHANETVMEIFEVTGFTDILNIE